MKPERKRQVLLVDDDPQVLEVYVGFLEGQYDLRTATTGERALEELTDEAAVVLLDRRVADTSGDEVVDAIEERGYDCRVALVTALTPEVDIVDMRIDDCLVKPVTGSKLRNVVDSLLRWDEYDEVLGEYYELARKATALEDRHVPTPLEPSEEYRRLKDRLSSLEAEAEEVVEGSGLDEEIDALDDVAGGTSPDNVESVGASR